MLSCRATARKRLLVASRLSTSQPYRAFAEVLSGCFPPPCGPARLSARLESRRRASVHPAARLEAGVVVDPGAVIGPGAEIGAGALIGANAVIGPNVRIGRDSARGAKLHGRFAR